MMYFILTFFFGAAVGSFVNVLIDRTIAGQDWVRGRSHCDHCKKNLAWYDLIPILSFAFYGGKSRCCKIPLSYQYPVVEILVGLLFVWWIAVGFWFFQLVTAPLIFIQPAFWLFTGILLMILGLADLFYGVVLLNIVWFGAIMTIVYRLILWHYGAYQLVDLQSSILLSGAFFAFFWLLWKMTKGRGMADGDMYIALYMGLILGWPKGLVALMGSFILGAIVGVLLIVTKIKGRHETVPFVPFMIVAMGVAMLWGEKIINYVY
ncbi:MAG: prepilin peptidase [bacterium]